MTRARPPAVIVQMPQTCGSLACIERANDYTRNCYRSAEDQRKQRQQRERRRRARARRKFAFTLAVLIVAGLLAGLMPWSGTAPELPADDPPDIEKANSAAGLTAEMAAGQVLLVTQGQDKPATYTPPAAEVEALAKMLYGEARGIASGTEKAACVWCVLNRVDDPRFPDTVLEVLEAPYQFSGYSADYPVLPELEALAADVLTRYHAERDGEENVGRVLPPEYCFFTGDGKHNHFTIGWQDTETWGWTLESPYEN